MVLRSCIGSRLGANIRIISELAIEIKEKLTKERSQRFFDLAYGVQLYVQFLCVEP